MKGAPEHDDLFSVLGLPRRYGVDVADLERRHHQRSRMLHPDRVDRAASGIGRMLALRRIVQLNDAYRVLKDPRGRARYLLDLLEPGVRSQPALEPAFLEEQLEARERLSEAVADGDRAAIAELAEQARKALAVIDRDVAELLSPEQPPADALAAVRAALARARYHEGLLREADTAACTVSPP